MILFGRDWMNKRVWLWFRFTMKNKLEKACDGRLNPEGSRSREVITNRADTRVGCGYVPLASREVAPQIRYFRVCVCVTYGWQSAVQALTGATRSFRSLGLRASCLLLAHFAPSGFWLCALRSHIARFARAFGAHENFRKKKVCLNRLKMLWNA